MLDDTFAGRFGQPLNDHFDIGSLETQLDVLVWRADVRLGLVWRSRTRPGDIRRRRCGRIGGRGRWGGPGFSRLDAVSSAISRFVESPSRDSLPAKAGTPCAAQAHAGCRTMPPRWGWTVGATWLIRLASARFRLRLICTFTRVCLSGCFG